MQDNFLNNVSKSISPFIKMAMELGITYQEFDNYIKAEFIKQSEKIVKDNNGKVNVSSISMISGIDRISIAKIIKKSRHKGKGNKKWISIPSRVIAAWILKDLDKVIPYSTEDDNVMDFIKLSSSITTDKPAKIVLKELLRLNRVSIDQDNNVKLLAFDSTTPEDKKELLEDFADNLKQHALAGVANLNSNDKSLFLEQAIKVDGIYFNSAKLLAKFGSDIWRNTSKEIMQKAYPISEKEEEKGGKHKLTFGVYCYYK